MKIGYHELRAVTTEAKSVRILGTVFTTFNCTIYKKRHPDRFELINQFDVDEAITKFNEKINGTKSMDIRHKESRINSRDILIGIRDGLYE